MSNLYAHMKRMLPVAEAVGNVTGVALNENWCGIYDRITVTGTTHAGHDFELALEIKLENKEEEKDAEKLE